MKHKAIIAIALALVAGAVYAKCTTQTVVLPSGEIKTCSTCCTGDNCTTLCF